MRLKILVIIAAMLPGQPGIAQNIDRWIRLPLHDNPRSVRNLLDDSRNHGLNLHFSFEKQPVNSLLRLINKNIPEAAPKQAASETPELFIRNTTILDELDLEAAAALQKPAATPVASGPMVAPATASTTHNASVPVNITASPTQETGSLTAELPLPTTALPAASATIAK